MAENLIPEIVKMLGVGTGEEFKLKCVDNGQDIEGTFYFKENELYFVNEAGKSYIRNDFLPSVLRGELEIVKLPWKPKEEEHYYTFTSTYKYTKWKIGLNCWHTEPQNLAFLKAGWVFRTRQEAEAALPKVAAEMGVEYEI
jgi:hypothetical protein